MPRRARRLRHEIEDRIRRVVERIRAEVQRRARRYADEIWRGIRRGWRIARELSHFHHSWTLRIAIWRLLPEEIAWEMVVRELRTYEQMTWWERILFAANLRLLRFHGPRFYTHYFARRTVEWFRRHFIYKWPAKVVIHVEEWTIADVHTNIRSLWPELYDDGVRAVVRMSESMRKIELEPVLSEAMLRFVLEELVAYYKREVCKSNLVAVRITPVVYHEVAGKQGRFYISRWTPIMVIKPDPYVRRAVPIDFHFVTLAHVKPEEDKASVRSYAGEGPIDYDTEVVTARDSTRNVFLRGRVRDIVFTPYRVARDFARALGTPEKWIHVTHCSLYVIPARSTATSRKYRRLGPEKGDLWLGEMQNRDPFARLEPRTLTLIARRKGFT